MEDNNEHTETKKPYKAGQTYWKPFFLSGTAVLCFAGVFLVSIIRFKAVSTASVLKEGFTCRIGKRA